MKMRLNRETFIALRARRQGYRIAREYLDPPIRCRAVKSLDPDAVEEYRFYIAEQLRAAEKVALQKSAERQTLISWGLILLFCVSMVIAWMLWLHYRRPD